MNPTTLPPHGVLRGIAWRPADGAPMREIPACTIIPGRGLDLENRKPGKREVTLLSWESWREVCAELAAPLPWHTRRANLLIEGIDFAAALGQVLTIGDARLRIHGETRPCGLMDQQHAGLRKALEPRLRGGVHGQVLASGKLRVGDPVTVISYHE